MERVAVILAVAFSLGPLAPPEAAPRQSRAAAMASPPLPRDRLGSNQIGPFMKSVSPCFMNGPY